MTYSQGKRRKVMKILAKHTAGIPLEPGEVRAVGRYIEKKEEAESNE